MTAATEKRNPVNAETDKATGSRYYIHPKTGERFISVTTVLGNISKFGLPDWSARLAAEAALDRLPWLVRCSRVAACNATKTDDACGQCRECAVAWLKNRHNEVRDEAASLGGRLHDAAEQITLFGEGATVDPEVQPFLDQYLRWRNRYQPEFLAAEMTVISRKWGYAGTLDQILRFTPESRLDKQLAHLTGLTVCSDIKTGKHLDIPKGWQVAAYAKADAVLLPDGSEEPMPKVDAGLILHIRPDIFGPDGELLTPAKVQMREVHLTDSAHAAFVHMLRVAEGLTAGLNTVLSRPVTLKDKD